MAVPIKGSSNRMLTKYRATTIDRDGISRGMTLIMVDTDFYKDMIFARFFRDEENGGWYLHDKCDAEYAEMVTAEHKVIERDRGRLVSRWRPKVTGADNHYLDCEVYAACAADVYGLRTLSANQARQERQPAVQQEPQHYQRAESAQHRPMGSGNTFRRRKWRGW